jgi:hypothetical protein
VSYRTARIAATLKPLDGFESGITLVSPDARTHFGILAILRTADLGPFTSSEITILTLALDALSDRLSALRLQLPQQIAAEPATARQMPPRSALRQRSTCWTAI